MSSYNEKYYFQDTSSLEESGRSYLERRYRKEPLENEPNCGLTPQNAFSKRIIGGERAKFAELPWQVINCNLLFMRD